MGAGQKSPRFQSADFMNNDKEKTDNKHKIKDLTVSADSMVREPNDKGGNGTLTSKKYEIEIIRARKRALDAQKAAEEAIMQAGGPDDRPSCDPAKIEGEKGGEPLKAAGGEAVAEKGTGGISGRGIFSPDPEAGAVPDPAHDNKIEETVFQAQKNLSRDIQRAVGEAQKKVSADIVKAVSEAGKNVTESLLLIANLLLDEVEKENRQ